jgi:hypothetical protein
MMMRVVCRVCGIHFSSPRCDAITCSTTCRQRLRRGQAFAYLTHLSTREQRAERRYHEAMDEARATDRKARAARLVVCESECKERQVQAESEGERSWGGRRKGAGRKRKLAVPDRREIANDYFVRMRKDRDLEWQVNPPRREDVIRILMADYRVTHRMVERCLAEFLPDVRSNAAMFKDAREGAEIQPLPARKIEKLKPGVYAGKKLRLIVKSDDSRKWVFRFFWRSTVRDMVLGGSEMSLAMARERATTASRMLAAGQNPIDGSWLSAALQSAKSKS